MHKIIFLLFFSFLFVGCSSDDASAPSEDTTFLPIYDTSKFSFFEEDGLYGYYNRETGKIVIKPQFHDARSFNKYGLAIVKINNAWGVISHTGKYILKPVYEEIEDYDNLGLARVKQRGKYGLVDVQGGVKLEIIYDFIDPFSNMDYAVIAKDKKYGLLGRNLKFLLEPQFDDMPGFTGETGTPYTSYVTLGDKVGLINTKGDILLKAIYDKISRFSLSGIAHIVIEGKHGLYNINGNMLEPKYEFIGEKEENYQNGESSTYFKVVLKGLWGAINESFDYIITPRFSADFVFPIFSYNSSVTILKIGGKMGIVNKQYDWVVQPNYDNIEQFYDEPSTLIVRKGTKVGVIDLKEKEVVPILFDNVSFYGDKIFYKVYKGNKESLYNLDGKALAGFYDEVREFKTTYYYPLVVFKNNNKVGLADMSLNKLTELEYDDYSLLDQYRKEGDYFVGLVKNNKWGLFDLKSKQFRVPLVFEYSLRAPNLTDDRHAIWFIDNRLVVYDFNGNKTTDLAIETANLTIESTDGFLHFSALGEDKNYFVNYRTGKILKITTGFDGYFAFLYNGNFGVIENSKSISFINREGTLIKKLTFDEVDRIYYNFHDKLFKVRNGSFYGLVSADAKIIVKPDLYTEIEDFKADNLATVRVGAKSGKINREGKLVVPLK